MTQRTAAIGGFLMAIGVLLGSAPGSAQYCANDPSNTLLTCFGGQSLGADTGGINNDAFGLSTLMSNTSGSGNVAFGDGAMWKNTTGILNAAVGMEALELNTTGSYNVAFGAEALLYSTADGETGIGYQSLYNTTTGAYNTATGYQALYSNTTGSYNAATGNLALFANTTGAFNVGAGPYALNANTTGFENTAVGPFSLMHELTGIANVAVGFLAGNNYTGSESNNIAVANMGVAGESGVIRIGTSSQSKAFVAGIYGSTVGSGVPVYVNSAGQLGTTTSSRRFKEDIADLGAASDVLMRLRPVSFRYKAPYDDGRRTVQYGLIAEEVAAIEPGLVQFGDDGEPLTVRYHFVNAMLLGEVQKQHATIDSQAARLDAQAAEIADLKSALAALSDRLATLQAAVSVH